MASSHHQSQPAERGSESHRGGGDALMLTAAVFLAALVASCLRGALPVFKASLLGILKKQII